MLLEDQYPFSQWQRLMQVSSLLSMHPVACRDSNIYTGDRYGAPLYNYVRGCMACIHVFKSLFGYQAVQFRQVSKGKMWGTI